MGENSKIEWTHHTFNAWTGCTKVSPACDHCYAEAWAKRSGLVKWGHGEARRRTTPANWREPVKWNKRCADLGIRERVFCNSLSDVFDAEVDDQWRDDLMGLIAITPNLDWLLLTKRPKVMREYAAKIGGLPQNVRAGTTAENQTMIDLRAPDLFWSHDRYFLSIEPILGPVTIPPLLLTSGKLWVIVGGESGKGWRQMDLSWVRSLRDQCEAAGVPFLFKQYAAYDPKPLGRLLDGREHSEFPA